MKFVFIDEVCNSQKNKNFIGLGALIINVSSYLPCKRIFDKEFSKLNWNKKEEFKGKYLFSQKGDSAVSIEKRINFVKEIARSSIAKTNARFNFLFCCNHKENNEKSYLELLSKIVKKIRPDGSGHKSLIAYFIDNNESINKDKIVNTVYVNKSKNSEIFERPFLIDSDNYVPGIIIIDILCYLKSWIELNKEEDPLELFPLKESDKKKIKTVKEIIALIKNIKDIK